MVIRQVFQLGYINHESWMNLPGIGDILRGSLALLQHCEQTGEEFQLDLRNHPLGKLFLTWPMDHLIPNQSSIVSLENSPYSDREIITSVQ